MGSSLLNWFRQLAAYGRLQEADFVQIEEKYLSREEVKSMLAKALERERERIRQVAKAAGIEIGIEVRNRQIVAAMHQNGFDLPTIATILQLTPAEVTRLLQAPPARPAPPSEQA